MCVVCGRRFAAFRDVRVGECVLWCWSAASRLVDVLCGVFLSAMRSGVRRRDGEKLFRALIVGHRLLATSVTGGLVGKSKNFF